MKNNNFLIIGRTPPPIGGVTIHVQRLLQHLKLRKLPFVFIELKVANLFDILIAIVKARQIHLHTSNTYVKFVLTLWSSLFNKKLIVTLHGDLFRFSPIKTWLEKTIIKISSIPILLNSKSYQEAIKLNKNSRMIGAFIPPVEIKTLPENEEKAIMSLKNDMSSLFCTNASRLNYDKHGNDIYNIKKLIEVFNGFDNLGLVISDPSGTYKRDLLKTGYQVNENVLLLSFPHDFNAVISLSDTFIRFTTTDGDALSVKEALYFGKNVLATNVVDRPKEVILFDNSLAGLRDKIGVVKDENRISYTDNSLDLLLELYNL